MAYWCGEQLVVTIDGPSGRRVVELAQPFARVGSHPEADVVIADEAVELRAVYLHATPAGVFCLYLDIETQDLEQKGTWLRPEEQIAIGPYWLSASLASAQAAATVPEQSPAAAGTAPTPLPVLLVYCGSKLKDKRRLRAQLSPLGRRPQCALQLRGEKVSGFHCVLFWEQGQLWCVDLNSSNGTQLNGENLVAGRVQIGDRLEVGDFGLVFQRLSSGGTAAAPAASQPSQQLVDSSSPRVSPDDATLPAAVLPPPPSAAELARDDEYRRLREQMEQEVSRLAREREEMHREWQQSSQQLVAQISQLHDEAARLTGERQALEQSRHEWQAERAALAEQLSERSNQLARLEAELATATATLAEKLAQVQAQQVQPAQSTDEVARLSHERQEMHQRWEQSSQQLEAKIGQLHDEAARLAGERQALEQSRHDWQAERAALTEQLAERSNQLARLEADLAAATMGLAEKLAQVEARAASAAVPTREGPITPETAPAAMVRPSPEAEPEPAKPAEPQLAAEEEKTAIVPEDWLAEAETLREPTPEDTSPPSSPEPVIESFSPASDPEPLPIAPSPAGSARPMVSERDQLPQFVSDRLVSLDQSERRQQLIWWSAGGIGIAALIALAVTIWMWAF